MGFLSGRISFERFQVEGKAVSLFDDKHLKTIDRHGIGKRGALTADGVEIGFTAGDHILDLDFRLDKNVINDALVCALRIDSNKVPADLLRAYQQIELAALAANNPSGYPTKQQRLEAKQSAEERCQAEAQTGKFRKMKQFPILWDARQNIVYFGSSSPSAVDRFVALFKEAFEVSVSRITAGTLARESAQKHKQVRSLEDLSPAAFVGPRKKMTIAWVADQFGSKDFLGNEFLVWLWWVLETQSDNVSLADESTVTCMMNKTLILECPFGETGKQSLSSEAPPRLPEAKRSLASGKLPRKTGLILVRHDEQYELTLQAETMAVGSASLPKLDSESGRPELEDRVDQIRHLTETVDLLFDAFCRRRFGSVWNDDLKKIREWTAKDE